MIVLTLADIERELIDIADDCDPQDRILALARRVGVQIETDKLEAAA
jgi:hypothetical protein